MKELKNDANIKEIENFLLFHMDRADDTQSKGNPALTKEDVWNIHMSTVLGGNISRTKNIIIKNITKEFGKTYE